MTIFKYFVLTLIMVSMLIGGIGQLITLNQTAAVYNAYFQMALGGVLFIWLSHKLIQHYEIKNVKPITNARDSK
jgi:ABC-type Mn2+/Zn2+ transport system permease subunit